MIAWVLVASILTSQDKRPVPDVAAQKEREILIRGIFKAEYSKSSTADKLALSKTLFKQGDETQDDPTARFVLLREARDLAAEAGDVEGSFRAIDALAEGYQIAPGAMKTAVLSTAAKSAKSPDDLRRLAEAFLKVAGEASAADDVDTASQAAASAGAAARRAKDLALVNKADAMSKEAADLKGKIQALAAAKDKLVSAPADPAANSTVGQYLCLAKGDWEAGLPHLARGVEGKLKELASKELAKPASPAEQVALGDGWWDLAEKERGRAREALRGRSLHWYEQAAPGLSGLNQVKVNQRIMSGTPAWMSKDLFGHWKLDEGAGLVANDLSPHKRHGRVEGPIWTKGRVGGALSFNGDRDRVHIDAGEARAPWTAVLWVLRQNSPNPTARLMDSPGLPGGSSLRLEQSGSADKVGITKYAVVDHAFNYTAPEGEWAHLAWVGTAKDVSLYANGTLVDVLSQNFPLSVHKLGSNDIHSLRGCLDDIRVYSRALNAGEVDLLYRYAPK